MNTDNFDQSTIFSILDFITEEGDQLKVYELPKLGDEPHLLKSFRGKVLDLEQLLEDKDNETIIIVTNHSLVYLEFTSNGKGTGRGFLIEYKALPVMPQSM